MLACSMNRIAYRLVMTREGIQFMKTPGHPHDARGRIRVLCTGVEVESRSASVRDVR